MLVIGRLLLVPYQQLRGAWGVYCPVGHMYYRAGEWWQVYVVVELMPAILRIPARTQTHHLC